MRRIAGPRRRLSDEERRRLKTGVRVLIERSTTAPPSGLYEHGYCGFECRACDAELAMDGRPDDVRWDDDLN